jgi:hypothetical protein
MEVVLEVNLQALLDEIRELEKSVVEQLKKSENEILYKIRNGSVIFENGIIKKHKEMKESIRKFLLNTSILFYAVAPVIYSMFIPAAILDLFTSFYQFVCFPVYGIQKVSRAEYIVLDRHKLQYLNWLEKFNCDYCGYCNGVLAYAREVAARTEQYFCPIRHALRRRGLHTRHANFLAYGDAAGFKSKLAQLRREVCKENPK